MRITWVQPADLMTHELWQSRFEGRDVQDVADRWVAAGGSTTRPVNGASDTVAPPQLQQVALALLGELDTSRVEDPHAPDDWPDIDRLIDPALLSADTAELNDRLLGAWCGRAIGCLLGKPVEKVPRRGIEEILRATGRWPLDRYFTAVGLPDEVAARWPWNRRSRTTSLEENIEGMPEDDDLNFTLMALRRIEQHGITFTSNDVARSWLNDLPAGRVFTAERAAYRNLLEGVSPPETAQIRNPFREWIGAEIRADLYGWILPGQTRRAAELAWKDARVSHTSNGLYGALFVAGMSAAAMCDVDVETVLDAGASVVPPRCALADAIAFGRRLGRETTDPGTAYDRIADAFPGMHWVHALNNTALMAYALTAGAGDFSRTICLAVMGGLDTDSTGATVGAITGAMAGGTSLPSHWLDPLRDRVASSIPGCDGSKLTDLAGRTRRLVVL